jgi:YYY domain-containing protein
MAAMTSADFLYLFRWWSILFACGIFFFPFTATLFSIMPDKGYSFSKIIGLLIISYVIFILGIKFIPFSQVSATIIAIGLSLLFISYNLFLKKSEETVFPTVLLQHWKFIVIEESIFFSTLLFWAYVRTFQPDIYGLEKYMDFGFVNSILRSNFFPPKDMWFTPYAINYYYFGHLITAVITKISGIPSNISYNLMIATLFAFCFTLSYTLITNILFFAQKEKTKKIVLKNKLFIFTVGIITASLVALGGNLHILYMFFTSYNTDNPVPFNQLQFSLTTIPNGYWYPNATRFIYNTIHEFPLYSFIVSDLHGHVLDIPIVFTIVFLLFSMYIQKKIQMLYLFFLSFLLACAYMTNAWDGGIYLLLTVLSIGILEIHISNIKNISSIKKEITRTSIINIAYYAMITIAGFFLFSLPFSLYFQTGAIAHGIGVLCAPTFLTKIQHIGPLLFETDHCQKSPLWQLAILHGFYYFFIVSFIVFLLRTKKLMQTDFFILLLIFLGTLLIIIPEFFYLKDIYPAHYRANTMFKLVYQAFMILTIVSGYVIFRIIQNIPSIKTPLGRLSILYFLLFTFVCTSLVLYYPVTAIKSYYENLTHSKSLDGTLYLKTLHPDDYVAIQWINKNIQDQPVIVEAQGDSYTDYERISTNTGLPTILGWTVHEWLWRGTYDIPAPRISEVQTFYETTNVTQAVDIIRKYHVRYVYVGDLERQKYTKLTEIIFKKIGHIIYHHGNTRIYQINES